jgi:hypothetical protein
MKSKSTLVCLVISALVLPAVGLVAQTPPALQFPAASPTCTIKQRVGLTDIEIVYSRPGVKGRQVFGGLVPYGEVWRTGANQPTKITFSTPVKFGGADVPAGTYGLFTIPGEKEWTVILSKVPGNWGAYSYDAKNDLVRVQALALEIEETIETFMIDVNQIRDESAMLWLVWDKTAVGVKIELDLVATLVPQIEAVMASAEAKKPYAAAAMFYLDHNLDLKKAFGWIDSAIAAQPDAFYLIYRKGLILEKMGDKAGALAAAKQSLEMASKAEGGIKAEYTRLNEALIARLK